MANDSILDCPLLYQNTQTGLDGFSDQPVGALDMDQFLSGSSEIFQGKTVRESRKKTLLLCDNYLNSHYTKKIKQHLEVLMDAGFEIFSLEPWVEKGESSYLITKTNLNDFFKNSLFTNYLTQEKYDDFLHLRKKTAAEVHVLNSYFFEALLSEKEWQSLSEAELFTLKTSSFVSNPEQILGTYLYSKDLYQYPKRILVNAFPLEPDMPKKLEKIKQTFPEVIIEYQYEDVVINTQTYLALDQYLNNPNNDFTKIKTVSIGGNSNTNLDVVIQSIKNLFVKKHNIETIKIHNFEVLKKIEHLVLDRSIDFSTLTELIISNAKSVDLQCLKHIVSQCPHLKKITMMLCDDVPNDLQSVFPNIEVDISGCTFASSMSQTGSTSVSETHRNRKEVNAQTELGNTPERIVSECFIDKAGKRPECSTYRLDVYQNVELKPGNHFGPDDHPFIFVKKGDPLYKTPAKKINFSNNPLFSQLQAHTAQTKHYLGARTRYLEKGEFVPLPSLSPNETITDVYLEGANEDEVEILYSERDRQYGIRLKDKSLQKRINVEFLLSVPQKNPAPLDKDIEEFFNYYKAFKQPKEKLDYGKKCSAIDWLKSIKEKQVGRCETRSLACLHEFTTKFSRKYPDMKLNAVDNGCHTFIEFQLKEGDAWIVQDLGGYPAKVTTDSTVLNQHLMQKPKKEVTPKEETVSNEKSKKDAELDREKYLNVELEEYIEKIYSHYNGKNILLNLESNQAVESMQQLLRHKAKKSDKPFYYIDSPEEVRCLMHTMKRGADGMIKTIEPPGGLLYEFLTKKHEKPPVLLINWQHFSDEDIIQLNTLIDEERFADNTPIPKECTVVGVYNLQGLNAYSSTDFTDRNKVKDVPFDAATLKKYLDLATSTEKQKEKNNPIDINLHNSHMWKSLLLGRYQINEEGVYYEEGPLLKTLEAIKNKKSNTNTIYLHDAPWGDRRFDYLMEQIKIEKKITVAGKTYDIPEGLQIVDGAPFVLSHHCAHVTHWTSPHYYTDTLVLNPSTLAFFLQRYQIDNDAKKITTAPGFLYDPNVKELNVYVSHDLPDSSWSLLLDIAEKENKKINFYAPNAVKLPRALSKVKKTWTDFASHLIPAFIKNLANTPSTVSIIESTDVDNEIIKLRNSKDDIVVIDISDAKFSDLLEKCKRLPQLGPYHFEHEICALTENLRAGRHVVLTGHFSLELQERLASLLLPGISHTYINNKRETDLLSKGKLTLITREALPHFTHLPNYRKTTVPIKTNKLEDNPLISDAKQRLPALENALKNKPFVIIMGGTGVGKSTFIDQIVAEDPRYRVYSGVDELEEWMNDNSNKRKILFIDEANIYDGKKCNWTEFVSMLHNNPPRVLINGKLKVLDKNHKVVFAGNPFGYGGERHEPHLFAEYPNHITFAPLSSGELKESILKPAFAKIELSEKTKVDINTIFLDIYNEICKISGDDINITPRELQMMALMWMTFNDIYEIKYPSALAKHCARKIAEDLIPEGHKEKEHFKEWCDKNQYVCDSIYDSSTTLMQQQLGDFVLTQSRKPMVTRLETLLKVREFKQKNAENLPHNMAYGGLNGIVIEGEPGIGKSDFVCQMLLSQGFKEGFLQDGLIEDNAKVFYRLPVKMPNKNKKALLEKAAKQGAVVLLDEINSAPVKEKFLNQLLSPSKKKNAAKEQSKPGFLLIATQNPIKMKARRRMSKALQRRLLHTQMNEYSKEEMIIVLKEKFKLSEKIISEGVEIFLKTKNEAIKNHSRKIPTFRALIRACKKLVEEQKTQPASEIIAQVKKITDRADLINFLEPLSINARLIALEAIKENLHQIIKTPYYLEKLLSLFAQNEQGRNIIMRAFNNNQLFEIKSQVAAINAPEDLCKLLNVFKESLIAQKMILNAVESHFKDIVKVENVGSEQVSRLYEQVKNIDPVMLKASFLPSYHTCRNKARKTVISTSIPTPIASY